mmetsp:Transcript_83252/g.231740  ORF Transcript_83252/g.231740 Transcript_83252/m.231740 type:complete len:205 (+) Transcript_83252:53-667(+)
MRRLRARRGAAHFFVFALTLAFAFAAPAFAFAFAAPALALALAFAAPALAFAAALDSASALTFASAFALAAPAGFFIAAPSASSASIASSSSSSSSSAPSSSSMPPSSGWSASGASTRPSRTCASVRCSRSPSLYLMRYKRSFDTEPLSMSSTAPENSTPATVLLIVACRSGSAAFMSSGTVSNSSSAMSPASCISGTSSGSIH